MSSTLRRRTTRPIRAGTAAGVMLAGILVAAVLLAPASANPDHYAGDYFMFAKALAPGTTDRTANEPSCDGSNHKQADISGSTSFFYGRIHSNADLANSGASNTFVDTASPNPEITYGVNEPGTCQLQANPATYNSGAPTNIAGDGDASSVQGPYQIGPKGWPGSLGDHLDANGETFGNDVTQVLPGASCHPGTSLTGTSTYTITAADAGRIICNGTGLINFGQPGLGSLANPFRITMISHGPIEMNDSNLVLAPASHGVLAWTDMLFSANATSIKLSGQNINVPERAILFTPRSGQDVSGSDQATLCLQMIGQGALKASGSNSHFGPLAPGCGVPAEVVTEVHAKRGGNDHDNLGAGFSAVEAGTEIHDKVVVGSHTTPPSNLTGTITVNRYDNGTCTGTPAATATYLAGSGYTPGTTVTIDDVLPFTPAVGVYSYRASYGGDANRNMASPGTCEGPVHVVDASVAITPATDVNKIGDDHDLTITATVDGGAIATPGAAASAAVVSGPGTFVDDAPAGECTTPAGASPQACGVTLRSTTVGTTVVSASATIPVDVNGDGTADLTLERGTGTTTTTGAAEKKWVDARITIGTSGTNRVNDAHTFTFTVEKDDGTGWKPAQGVTLTPSLLAGSVGSIMGGTCATTGTDTDGECTIIIDSAEPGTTTVHASGTVTVLGLDIEVATDGYGAHSISNMKTWVDARISIGESGTNRVDDPHTFTVTVEKNDGTGWTAASGVTVTPSKTGVGTITGGTCGGGTTDANGQCTVIVNSLVPGTTTLHATASVHVEGLDLEVDTDGVGSGTVSNVKTWVDARISIGESGTNRVDDPHTFTVTVEKNDGTGWTAASGVTVTPSKTGVGTITGGTCGGGATGAGGQCTVIVNSLAPGVTTVNATATVSVLGVPIDVDTAGYGAEDVDNEKTWVDARISIEHSGINRVGDPHIFTVTVEADEGQGLGFMPVDGVIVTAALTGVGQIDEQTCNAPGTDGSGECTVTIGSDTPGISTVNASAAILVGGVPIDVSTAGDGAGDVSNEKTWVDARISIEKSETNRAGDPHTFTVKVESHDGSAASWQPVEGVVVTPEETGVGEITAETCTAGTLADGTCTITVSSDAPGQSTVHATAFVSVGPLDLDVDTAGEGAFEVDNVKTWVDARISIGDSATNKVGDPHTFTVTVELHDGLTDWAPADGIEITPSAIGVGTIDSETCTARTDVQGQCTITVTSAVTGQSTVNATGTVSVGGLDLEVDTDGVGAHTVSNVKAWANARISIVDDGTNQVGDPHTFTVTVEQDVGGGWGGVEGVTVTVEEDGIGSITEQTCDDPGTDEHGKCTVTVNSSSPGFSTVTASATVTIDGAEIDVSTAGAGAHTVSNTKTWVDARISIGTSGTNPVGEAHTFTVTVEQHDGTAWAPAAGVIVAATETGVGEITAQTCNTGTTPEGTCTVTVNSQTAGSSTVHATATVIVGGVSIGVDTAGYGAHQVSNVKTWVDAGKTLLIIDEDSLDNGIHYNQTGGPIVAGGPSFFTKPDVNDDKSSHAQRDVLRYFAQNPGKTITVRTGQTGDEGWFAPNCIPQKWISGTSNTCLTDATGRQTAIGNYFGLNGQVAIPSQSRLDKIPAVMPLRARGLVSLIGKDVCAVVYDSDISINYPSSSFPYTEGNLQGETLGIVAFRVNEVRRLNRFSSSTLPEVQLTILDTATCGSWTLLNAPVPRSSSVPNDIDPLNLTGVSSNGYRALVTRAGELLVY